MCTPQEKPNRPPSDWPQKGVIEFENYTTSYRKEMEPVLRNINLNVNSLQKVMKSLLPNRRSEL
jgi:ABC-type multidrug transport system fused ATPase/permease subunit